MGGGSTSYWLSDCPTLDDIDTRELFISGRRHIYREYNATSDCQTLTAESASQLQQPR
jgi:hypothetical protein